MKYAPYFDHGQMKFAPYFEADLGPKLELVFDPETASYVQKDTGVQRVLKSDDQRIFVKDFGFPDGFEGRLYD